MARTTQAVQRLEASLLAALAAVALLLAGPAAAEGYRLSKVVLTGDPAPGLGGTFFVSQFALGPTGRVVFTAIVPGGSALSGVFLHDRQDGISPIALEGDPFPGGTLGRIKDFPSFNRNGDVSFGAPLGSDEALLLSHGAAPATLVRTGELLPAPHPGSFDPGVDVTRLHGLNDAGAAVFRSRISGGAPVTEGIFRAPAGGGPPTPLALTGDNAPGTGAAYASFGFPLINNRGQVAFDALLDAAPGAGIFLQHGAVADPLVLAGDPAPNTDGGSFDGFLFPVLNERGDVLFVGGVANSLVTGGVFMASSDGVRAVFVEGDPGPGGGSWTQLGGIPWLTSAGEVAFSAELAGGSVSAGVFLLDPDSGTLRTLVATGDPAPVAGGATFSSFGMTRGNAYGDVAFSAELSDGAAGIFLADAAPPVPALRTPATALLILLLAAIGLGAARLRA